MSVQAMSWVIEHSPHKGTEYLVLLMVANHTNADGRDAYPGLAKLAKKCRLSERQTLRALKALELSGALIIGHVRGRTRHSTYQVVMGDPEKPVTDDTFSKKRVAGDTFSGEKPVTHDTFSPPPAAENVTSGAEKHDIPPEKPQEQPSLTVLTTTPSAAIAHAQDDGTEALHAVLSAFADRGYDGNPGWLRALAKQFPALNLELEAHAIAEWLSEPRHAKKLCSKRFITNWLKRADLDRRQADLAATTAPAPAARPGTNGHPPPPPRNPGPPPLLPEGVDLVPVKPEDVQRALAGSKGLTLPERLARWKNGTPA